METLEKCFSPFVSRDVSECKNLPQLRRKLTTRGFSFLHQIRSIFLVFTEFNVNGDTLRLFTR